MMPCKHASTGCTCLEMIICTAAIAGEPVDEMFCYEPVCLWEAYQADQTYENCCRWLKHRAYGKLCIDSLAFCCRTLERTEEAIRKQWERIA